MANEKNLKPCRTKKEARERGAKGGQKSGVSRRRKRILQEAAQIILNADINGAGLEELKQIGLDMPTATMGLLLIKRILDEAMNGNIQAAKVFLELAGEGETFNLRREELEIKRAGVKALEKAENAGNNGLMQLVASLNAARENRQESEEAAAEA